MTGFYFFFEDNPTSKPDDLTERQKQMIMQLCGLDMLDRADDADLIFSEEEMDWLFLHGFISPVVVN